MAKTRFTFWILLFCSVNGLFAQEPFVCDGSFFLILRNEPSSQSKLFKIESNDDLSDIIFDEVGTDSAGVYLNSIGYRRTDNFIYGIDPNNFNLYKVDSEGNGFFLDNIHELDTLCNYIAGDVSLDGKYLILVEQHRVNNANQDIALRFIDLTSPEYVTTRLPLVGPNGAAIISRTADVAIHPFNGLMYGYDLTNKKLITYDLETGMTSSENFATDADQPRGLGALFFNEFSRLLGYGRHPDSLLQNTLYEMDINTGLSEILKIGPDARGNDGCRCIKSLGIQKTVWPTQTLPCTEVSYTIRISNSTGVNIENVSLTDTLDSDLRFLSIAYNPFLGNFNFDTLSNVLQFSNLTLLPGIDSIVFTAFVELTTNEGIIYNQAEITNPSAGQESIIRSDYPPTIEREDPTPLEIIEHLEISEIYLDTNFCSGEALTLVSQFPNADYDWEDFNNETTDRITIETGGTYFLTTIVGCQIITEIFQVAEEDIVFSLGGDQYIELGESVQISPRIQSTSPDSIYEWTGINSSICLDCPTQNYIPLENEIVHLSITNQAGCINEDAVAIFVNADRSVFVPNAFSPNGDGLNDLVFPSTKLPRQISYFRIYNRWGALIFEQKDGRTNDPSFGWNGIFKGEVVNNGVFVYDLLLIYPDGVEQQISGDITVIK